MTNIELAAAEMVAEVCRLPANDRVDVFVLAYRLVVEGSLFGIDHTSGSAGARVLARGLAEWGNAMKWFVYGCVAPSGQVDCHGRYIHGDNCSFCGQPIVARPRERARLR